MTKDVLLTIAGVHCDILFAGTESSSEEPVEVVTPATYYFKNGKHYIVYDVLVEGEPGHNIIRISEGKMKLTESGQTDTHLLFEKGKLNVTDYETPFGTFTVGIYTTDLQMDIQEDEIKVLIRYKLELNDIKVADCDIHVHVSAKKKGA